MGGDASEGHDIFPGSRGSAHLVAWIDRVLTHLRHGHVHDARAALEAAEWRTLDLGGIPRPIRNQLDEDLHRAAGVLAEPHASPGAAEEALLIARSRCLPGA